MRRVKTQADDPVHSPLDVLVRRDDTLIMLLGQTQSTLLQAFQGMYSLNSYVGQCAYDTIRLFSVEECQDHSTYLDSVLPTLVGTELATAECLQSLLLDCMANRPAPVAPVRFWSFTKNDWDTL